MGLGTLLRIFPYRLWNFSFQMKHDIGFSLAQEYFADGFASEIIFDEVHVQIIILAEDRDWRR